jgi:glycosyltransferase involved in cell wall biosynthesis
MSKPDLEAYVVAMTDHGRAYDYPTVVRFQIQDQVLEDYVRAADFLNQARFDAVSLQHEFGIFGGEAGGHIIQLLSRLRMPVVTTLHTVLSSPTLVQRDVMRGIIDTSTKLIVMAEKGRELLRNVYGVPSERIEVIPHGIPDVAFLDAHFAKAKLGFSGKPVILTFGLLSPNKGIEFAIDAMPAILVSSPDAVYVVLGATHPNLVQQEGEAYRESLQTRARDLGVDNHVVFIDQFVDQPTLLEYIAMCDVYVTPYLNEAQMTSGTLAYSYGSGKAVVSTPYWHARELLDEGRGILVPFADSKAIATAVAGLLTNDVRRHAMRKRAYATSRLMTWAQTAKRYRIVLDEARTIEPPARSTRVELETSWRAGYPVPDISLRHFLSMCDSTGLLQHAVYSVPDRSHGYCIDDNARALIVAARLASLGERHLSERITARFAAFIQHAWNPDNGRFRNFMSYDRRWLEDVGSEDSHGRTLWALGECARSDPTASRRQWAATLFRTALPAVETFQSPRAWAFILLGLDAYCEASAPDQATTACRDMLAQRLMSSLAAVETADWVWFENLLAYDNARLPEALLLTGLGTKSPVYIDAGLRTLRWLMAQQTAPTGHFRPVGTESFGVAWQPPKRFDQQPVEAAATISACLTAWRANSTGEWEVGALRAFSWFLGDNDLACPLVEQATGSCADGLHPDRPSENKGAESVLSYLLGLTEIRRFMRTDAGPDQQASVRVALRA